MRGYKITLAQPEGGQGKAPASPGKGIWEKAFRESGITEPGSAPGSQAAASIEVVRRGGVPAWVHLVRTGLWLNRSDRDCCQCCGDQLLRWPCGWAGLQLVGLGRICWSQVRAMNKCSYGVLASGQWD